MAHINAILQLIVLLTLAISAQSQYVYFPLCAVSPQKKHPSTPSPCAVAAPRIAQTHPNLLIGPLLRPRREWFFRLRRKRHPVLLPASR